MHIYTLVAIRARYVEPERYTYKIQERCNINPLPTPTFPHPIITATTKVNRNVCLAGNWENPGARARGCAEASKGLFAWPIK